MKRAALIFGIPLILLLLGVWMVLPRGGKPLHASNKIEKFTLPPHGELATTPSRQPANSIVLLGETILRDYANTNLSPQNDLTLMARLIENSLLLLKSAASRPLSANEDWADLLRGNNSAHERFLPERHLALNQRGQLIDRWGTPLFFHAVGGGRYEIRSAGPDEKLWTDDDIHRNPDGSFRRGQQLNPPALFQPGDK